MSIPNNIQLCNAIKKFKSIYSSKLNLDQCKSIERTCNIYFNPLFTVFLGLDHAVLFARKNITKHYYLKLT